jgi:predicted N-formylglutamate amidohydrolase
MQPITLSGSAASARLVLTCEHASATVPDEYAGLGLAPAQLADHIGWDIGAAALAMELNQRLGAPAVLSAASRLLVDCNRDLGDADLMPHQSHGVAIPGNAAIDPAARADRLARFYEPYHAAIDAQLVRNPDALLLSIHSFTPELDGCARPFDIGVLFDDFDGLADAFARDIAASGFAVRMNEPYSGLEGLIFSARSHGQRHGLRYLELEINNRLLRRDADVCAIAARLLEPIASLAALDGRPSAAGQTR